MTKYTPIESEFADSDEEAAYDAWFRAKVQHSLDNPGALIPHAEVMRRLDERIAERRRTRADMDNTGGN